jgi:hypothetical protein
VSIAHNQHKEKTQIIIKKHIDHCDGVRQVGSLSLPPTARTFPPNESAFAANLSGLVDGSYF